MGESVAVVAGATGLVGQELVRQLSADGAWREVRALVRRPLPPELTARTVRPVQVDYDHLDDPFWARADHVFCALGTTMRRAGSVAGVRTGLAPGGLRRRVAYHTARAGPLAAAAAGPGVDRRSCAAVARAGDRDRLHQRRAIHPRAGV